jgi:hypothetical protein
VFKRSVYMYITCIILEKHFCISIAPVQSRGGSLVLDKVAKSIGDFE